MDITAATRADIPEAAHLLGTVFAEDPAMKEYISRADNKAKALRRLFAVLLKDFFVPHGAVDLVRSPSGQLLGVALWAPPGVSMDGRHLLRMLPGIVRALGTSFPRAARLNANDSGAQPVFSHWYLFVIAASPAARGQGVGGALLDHGLARAGDNAIYLESTGPRSRALYERKGFIPLGVIPSPGPAPEVGMWRPGLIEDSHE